MAVESTLTSSRTSLPGTPSFDLRQAQLKELVTGFFWIQGAPVRLVSDHLVEVEAVPAVADPFEGREVLRLIFDREQALWYEDGELVAFGSPLLDRLLERLTHHEAVFAESFVDFNLGDKRPEELRPRLQFLNCEPTLQLCGAQYGVFWCSASEPPSFPMKSGRTFFYDIHRDLIQLPPCPGCGHQVRRW